MAGGSINNVVLVGRIVNDPETRTTDSGTVITNWRLAVDRGMRGEDGKDQTDFLNCVAFKKSAELVAQYCDKGSPIGIQGRIQSRTWEDKEGKRHYEVEIIANNVSFFETKAEAERRRGSQPAAAENPGRGRSTPPPAPAQVEEEFDDPFGS